MARRKLVDRTVMALAQTWMEDNRSMFPPIAFEALTQMLAEDLQSTLEDFTNPDYLHINIRHLRRRQEAEERS